MFETTTDTLKDHSLFTNEEIKTPEYSHAGIPTIPSEVTPETPIDKLNLNWREKDLPEKERTKHVHRLHPYLGKFIPQMVEIFIRKFFHPGQTILDPFCGSGTTLVQANELGLNSIGYDISAFNVMLSRAKVRKYDLKLLHSEVMDALNKLRQRRQVNTQLTLWEEQAAQLKIPQIDNDYLRKWFAPDALAELLTYRQLIQEGHYKNQDLLKVILSRSARSARLTTHYDLDFPKQPQMGPYWCHKHSRTCSPTTEAMKFISRYSIDTLRRIEHFSLLRTNANVDVRHSDSRLAKFPPFDGVITSPPYVGLIDYHEQHAYAYHLLGLTDRHTAEIGPASNGSSQKSKKQYQLDIAKVFIKTLDSINDHGLLIIIAHDSANLYPGVAALCNVKEVAVINRHVNRRTGRRSSQFYESIFIWQKP